MSTVRITKGGQISIPAAIRKRWRTDRLKFEDRGEQIVIEPLPADPLAASFGVLADEISLSSRELRKIAREEERQAEDKQTDRP